MSTPSLHELRQAAKDGDDMSAYETALLADGSPLAASTLTFFYALRDRYTELDRLLASDSGRTRWGVVRALAESFHEKQQWRNTRRHSCTVRCAHGRVASFSKNLAA